MGTCASRVFHVLSLCWSPPLGSEMELGILSDIMGQGSIIKRGGWNQTLRMVENPYITAVHPSLRVCALRKGRHVPREGFSPPPQCPVFLNSGPLSALSATPARGKQRLARSSGGEECHWPVGPSLTWSVIVQFLWPGLSLLVPPAGTGTVLQAV